MTARRIANVLASALSAILALSALSAILAILAISGCERSPLLVSTRIDTGTSGASGAGTAGTSGGGTSGAGTSGGGTAGAGTSGRGGSGAGAAGAGAGGTDGSPLELIGAPLIFSPTAGGFGLNAVLRSGQPGGLRVRVRDATQTDWTDVGAPVSPASDVAQWAVTGLAPGRRYLYEVRVAAPADDGPGSLLYAGSAVTARPPGATFTFAALADAHIEALSTIPPGTTVTNDAWGFDEGTLLAVARDIQGSNPDFMVSLGDMLDFHLFGFNAPPPDSSWTRLAYLDYRRMYGDTLGQVAHFPVIGNWDGENGCNTNEEIQRSLSQRLLYAPGPHPDTYPQGGGPNEDYYAFTWGDALFIVLNVMTYTPTCHLLASDPGLPDDWTLGDKQLAWLETTLAKATSKWRFTFIHHTVGGAAGDSDDSAYGRGGGQAAHVGEQAKIHALMLQYGVQIFFYAHDHVFTDMVVDGIHYTLPGSAGAPWKFDATLTGYKQYWPDSGYGRVTVGPTSVKVDFVAMGGQVLSSYSLP